MINYADVKVSDFEIDLLKLVGKGAKEIRGYLTHEYGGLSFKLTCIILDDDSKIGIEGEHDFPYIEVYRKYPQPNLDEETLDCLYEQQEEQ